MAENLTNECWEEAAIPAEIASLAVPVGAIGYHVDTAKEFKPDTLFCYDLELPKDFQPRCTDDEVESFYLWPVEQVMGSGEEFTLNCDLVIIDFLIRHVFFEPEDDDYLRLLSSLHPPLSVF